jgi:hypothetical protein
MSDDGSREQSTQHLTGASSSSFFVPLSG